MEKYSLKPRKGKAVFKVTIVADMNDGDYLTKIDEYSKERFDKGVIDELIELKKILHKDYALPEFKEQGYLHIPFDTQSGEPCHTLEELKVEFISEDGVISDVEF